MEEESIYSSLLDIIQYGAKIAHDEGNINQVHIQKQERFFTSGVKIVRFFFHFFFYFFFSVLILSAMILIFFIHEL